MAPSQSTLRDSGNEKKVVTKDIPLPLVPLDRKAPARDECQEFALKADPANPASPEYKFHMRHLKGTEDARGIMAWVDDIQRVIAGLGIADPIPAYSLYTQCMRGTALSTFEMIVRTKCADARSTALAAAGDDLAREAIRNRTDASFYDNDILADSLNQLMTTLMPDHILRHTKRYLRRRCRKPADMKVRMFYQHMANMILNELPRLPPFAANQTLVNDEIIDILLFATPNSWQVEMEKQNWDPMDHTVAEVVNFMERIENAEDMVRKGTIVNDNGNNKKKPAKKKTGGNNSNKNFDRFSHSGDSDHQFFCKVHGWCTHTTEQCHTAKKLAAEGKPIVPQKRSPNKSWSHKSEEAKKTSKEELGALVKEHIAKAMSAAQKSKKRPSNSDDEECNVLDLGAFNYKNMNDVSDEVSV
jgi:hypothetical protein